MQIDFSSSKISSFPVSRWKLAVYFQRSIEVQHTRTKIFQNPFVFVDAIGINRLRSKFSDSFIRFYILICSIFSLSTITSMGLILIGFAVLIGLKIAIVCALFVRWVDYNEVRYNVLAAFYVIWMELVFVIEFMALFDRLVSFIWIVLR